ncbi:hypothetical protein GCM10022381_12790 [Leifsonia kafniensis]|uniref:Aminoglycoside phosphotransferase domain-containing protein n=1 Tax=Leifsonia kafniensis TaxID=475957 RepID=A0ABP7KAQ4_9MICO
MTIKADIAKALRAHGITPEAPLVNLQRGSDIWSDLRTLVVKVGGWGNRISNLDGLRALRDAGVRSEQILIDEVIEVGDRGAVVVGYLRPDRPIRADDAEAVGALLRDVHEAMLASDIWYPPLDGYVFAPDDWLAQNIIIHGDLPYLVDLDLWDERERKESVATMCSDFMRQLLHNADDIAAFHRGYGTY